jgi:dTDP-4-dehydrorhamnose reductase
MWSEVDGSRRRGGEEARSAGLGGQRVLVTGAGGQLGRYLAPELRRSGAATIAFGSRPGEGIDVALDLADEAATMRAIAGLEPQVVIHAAACTDVDGIEREPERGERSNVQATRNVVAAARAAGAYLLAVSTDMVFSGDGGAPYAEDAATHPISTYGRSKLEAERAVLGEDTRNAVARTAWLYGGSGKHFPRTVLTVLRERGSIDVVDDEFGSPTFAGDLARALIQLTAVRGIGVFHLVNAGRASRFELACETAHAAGFDPELVRPVTTEAFLTRYPLPARRPADSALRNARAAALGIELRDWRAALREYVPVVANEIGMPSLGGPTIGG